MISIELPWPPSVNTYWRRTGFRFYVTKKGIDYRTETMRLCRDIAGIIKPEQKVRLYIEAYPPDKRRRDIDNTLKCLADSLQHAGVLHDDYQIDEIHIRRMPELIGKMVVTISVIH